MWRKEEGEEGIGLAEEARERLRGFGSSSSHDDAFLKTALSEGILIHDYKEDVGRDIQMVPGHVGDLWKSPDKAARTLILVLLTFGLGQTEFWLLSAESDNGLEFGCR